MRGGGGGIKREKRSQEESKGDMLYARECSGNLKSSGKGEGRASSG